MRTVYGANASPFVRKVRVFLTFPRKGEGIKSSVYLFPLMLS
jgi:hypothetical protein